MDHFRRISAPLNQREARQVSRFLLDNDETLCQLGPGRRISDKVIDMLLFDKSDTAIVANLEGTNLFLPSYFYSCLMFQNKYTFKKLKGRGNVCEAKKMFMPLILACDESWVLVVIDTSDHTLQLFNSCRDARSPLSIPELECLENVSRWYHDEMRRSPIPQEEGQPWILERGSCLTYCVKTNDFDCGMYTLAFAAILSTGCSRALVPAVTQEDIDCLRQRCILNPIMFSSVL